MSNSRYIATESQLTISPSNFCASARDSAVFPLRRRPKDDDQQRLKRCDLAMIRHPRSAQAPMNVVPVANQSENQQQQGDQQQAGGLRRIHCVAVMLVIVVWSGSAARGYCSAAGATGRCF